LRRAAESIILASRGESNVRASGSAPRDPEDRLVDAADRDGKREKMFDKTIADSFPASDPPSSRPDPQEDSFDARDD
jgi:hypothetical protein